MDYKETSAKLALLFNAGIAPLKEVTPEPSCALPRYKPGDIILTKDGEVGIIVNAHVIIDGRDVSWNRKMPDSHKSGWPPSYAMEAIPGFKKPRKYAWWTSEEFSEVVLGPLHHIDKQNELE